MVSYLHKVSVLGYSEIQESVDLVEDVEGCSRITNSRVLQGVVVD